MNNGVDAIVVTYNRRALLAECIECLQRQRPDPPDILVIDNASTDGTGEALAPLIDSGAIRYENTGRNLGARAAFSLACAGRWSWGMTTCGSWTTTPCQSRRL